ncbi:MAG: PorT family protein [Tidjanibacter sp.]|nr:PorT family protein [Tidjanibacter sp.]
MKNLENRDEFERLLQDKLSNYREEPPLGIFTRVESSLAKQSVVPVRERKAKRMWLYALAGVAVVAVMFVSSLMFFERDREVQPLLEDYVAASLDVEKLTDEAKLRFVAQNETDNASVSGRMKSLLSDTSNVYVKYKMLNDESVEMPDMLAVKADMPEGNVVSSIKEAMENNATYRKAAEKAKRIRDKEIERYWRQVFKENEQYYADDIQQRRGVSTSLFAGNFGTLDGNFNAQDVNSLASNNMSVPTGGTDRMMQPAMAKPELHHRMPVSVGVNVDIPLANRLSLVTGLNYTYLYSNSSLKQFSDYELSRRLHYLGIPLGVTYDLWRSNKFSVYVYGGGMLERALYGEEQKRLDGEVLDTERLSIKGFQTSVNASLGAMYRFTPGVGLYFEPGVSYYFENIKQPASYRTENPTSVSLKVGVKFSLK